MEVLAERFVAYRDRTALRIEQRRPELYRQLMAASDSILANIGEAWDETSPGDKCRFFRYAHRSAGECERLLVALRPSNLLTIDDLREGFRLLLDIKMDLNRLIRSTRP